MIKQRFAPFFLVLIVIITSCSGTPTPSSPIDTSIPANTVNATATRQPTTRPPTATRRPPTLAPATLVPTVPASAVTPLIVGQGYGAEKGFWQVFFTAPTGSRDAS